MPATEDYLRNLKTMHKVFCLSAVVLLVCTLWMMWADYDDEWRYYQRQALKHVADRDKQRIAQIKADPKFLAELSDLNREKDAVAAAVKSRSSQEDELKSKVRETSTASMFHMRKLREERAKRDVLRANEGLGIRDNLPAEEQAARLKAFEEQQAYVDTLEAEFKRLELESAEAKAALGAFLAEQEKIAKQIKDLEAEITRRQGAVNKIEPTDPIAAFKRNLMLLPIINGFNSPERITQDWMPKLKIDLGGMSKVDRFDRCRTCHVSIDSVAAATEPAFPHGDPDHGGFEHPYASHPRLDLFLTSSSPHPLPKFGCTVCHEGQGSGTTFTNASHTPNDPHIGEVWAQKSKGAVTGPDSHHHGWFDNHFWEHPMWPERFEESGCIRCHVNVMELGNHPKFGPTAPKVYRGYDLVKTYGCFGCHEINGFEGKKQIGPDLRLEPGSPEEMAKAAADPLNTPGKMKKVGPSLRHVALKAPEGWLAHWTEEPKKFRPTTKMPQFFHLTNQHDDLAKKFNPVEIAGVAQYLTRKSQPLDLLAPKVDYKPDAARGKELFANRGCAACHRHPDVPAVPGEASEYGPELSRIDAKLLPGQAGFNWLYTWLRDPHRYHPRAKMPKPDVEPQGEGEKYIDPAADIAAFLLKLSGAPADYRPSATYDLSQVDPESLDALVAEFLKKTLTNSQVDGVLNQGAFPIPDGGIQAIKGDEIELVSADGKPITDKDELFRRKLNYIGRRTISRYGCYGCHDIPNFEDGRPIGTALTDWGKKDRSRLAFEHIHEYAHHSGQADLGVAFESVTPATAARLKVEPASGVRVIESKLGAQTELKIDDVIVSYNGLPVSDAGQLQQQLAKTEPGAAVTLGVLRGGEDVKIDIHPEGSLDERIALAIGMAERHEFADHGDEEREMSAAFFYESLMHHGRPGFLWQKLRQPRSYDYRMVEVKPYDDRLRMPKFPLSEDEIEAIATFVLGLLAEPPADEYLYNPSGPKGDWIKGEYLLDQFNCASCHMLDLPTIRYGHDPANENEITSVDLSQEIPDAVALLKQLKPPVQGETGRMMTVKTEEGSKTLPIVQFHGLVTVAPDPDAPPEEQEYVVESWNTVELKQPGAGEPRLLPPTSKYIFTADRLQEITPGRGGSFAEWLAPRLVASKTAKDPNDGRQSSPPPLYLEGIKVQTPWLYTFLQNPYRLRHRTVLQMPKFNMSPDEAQALANYFAAADGAAYPYQNVPQREPEYLGPMNREFHAAFPGKEQDYLSESWKLLNGPLCIGCHYVGGRQMVVTKPEDSIRGPNLDGVANRLRPDWLQLWLYRPSWVTPYTSMPQNFPPTKKLFEDILGGNANRQTIAIRDALMNYHHLMETDGRVIYDPPKPQTTAAADQPVEGQGDTK